METARQHHRDPKRSIEDVPEFRAYLRDQGLPNLAAWRKRESTHDSQTLELRKRRLALLMNSARGKPRGR